ncbi:MAG: sigma-70 family RNA polymerase sigma factor [Sphingobacteriales bacterium]|nr:sigma-70 family RNA polymerase sigma factor [Sphingobacteriales bacterium]
MSPYNNQQILEAFNTSDSVFIEKVYNEMLPKIERYVLANKGSKEDIGDLIQDAFESILIIFTKSDFEFKNKATYSTFILSVVKNKWLSVLRKKKLRKIFDLNSQYNSTEQDETEHDAQIDLPDEEQIEKGIFEAEVKQVINFQIEKLNENCKKILFMRYQKGNSHKEIMTELILNTEGTSRERLRSCQEKLYNNIIKNEDYIQIIAEYYPFILKTINPK